MAATDRTALIMDAAMQGDPLLLRQRLEGLSKADIESVPLQRAVFWGKIEIVRELVRAGASVDAPHNGNLPLHTASYTNEPDIVKFLLLSGADVNKIGERGQTALHEAVRYRCMEVIETLLGHGADASIRDSDGFTPLQKASRNGLADVVELLIKSGAGVNIHGNDGARSLFLAVSRGSTDVAEVLLRAGVDRKAILASCDVDTYHGPLKHLYEMVFQFERDEKTIRPALVEASGCVLPCELAELCGDFVALTPVRRALEERAKERESH